MPFIQFVFESSLYVPVFPPLSLQHSSQVIHGNCCPAYHAHDSSTRTD